MIHDIQFFPLFIIVFIAALAPIAASRIRFIHIPAVILEILAGIVIGKSGLNLIPRASYLEFLYLSGFVMLMFLSGLEIDVHYTYASFARKKESLVSYLKNPLLSGIFIFIGTFSINLLFAYFVSRYLYNINFWFLAFSISTTSVGIVIPTLKERNLLSGSYGQSIVMSALVADFITIFLINIISKMSAKGWGWEVLIILILFLIPYPMYLIAKAIFPNKLLKTISYQLSHASTQIKVRSTIAFILFLVVVSEFIGAEIILGAFVAGVVLSPLVDKDKSALIMKLDAIGYGFFIPIFFIMVGVNFDLISLINMEKSWLLLIGLLVVAFLSKLVPAMLFIPVFGFKKALAAGSLLIAKLSLIIAAAEIGLRLNILTPGIASALITLSIVACLIAPILFSKFNPPDEEITDEKTIIVGGGKIGRHLGYRLKMHGRNSIIIDNSPKSIQKTRDMGLPAILGDGRDPEIYKTIRLNKHDYVVAVTGNDKTNIEVCQQLKLYYGHDRLIARDNNPANDMLFRQMGVTPMNYVMAAAITLENLVLRPKTYHLIKESLQPFEVCEVTLTNPNIDMVPIKAIPLHKDGFLVLIRRGSRQQIPHGDFILKKGDIVTIFGTTEAIIEITKLLEGDGKKGSF